LNFFVIVVLLWLRLCELVLPMPDVWVRPCGNGLLGAGVWLRFLESACGWLMV
jgi:hypothetical protein